MKKNLFLFIAVLLFKTLSAQTLLWQPYGPQTDGAVQLRWNNAHTKLYKGTYYNGPHVSLDSGITWKQIGPSNGCGWTLVTMKNDTLISTPCCKGVGLKYTINDGINWTRIDNGWADTATAYGIASNQTSIFVVTDKGIYSTSNNGTTWSLYSMLGGSSIYADGNHICVGGSAKVYISNNNGATWSAKSVGTGPFWSMYVTGNRILAGNAYGVYLSVNNGSTWSLAGMSGLNVLGLKLFGKYGFAGNDDKQIYFSSDSGATWTEQDNGITSAYMIWDFITIGNKVIAGGGAGGGTWATNFSPLGVNDFDAEKNIKLFPNPTNNIFTIRFDDLNLSSFSLFNSVGKEILQSSLKNRIDKLTIDTRDLANGIYIWKLTSTDQLIYTGKVVVYH